MTTADWDAIGSRFEAAGQLIREGVFNGHFAANRKHALDRVAQGLGEIIVMMERAGLDLYHMIVGGLVPQPTGRWERLRQWPVAADGDREPSWAGYWFLALQFLRELPGSGIILPRHNLPQRCIILLPHAACRSA